VSLFSCKVSLREFLILSVSGFAVKELSAESLGPGAFPPLAHAVKITIKAHTGNRYFIFFIDHFLVKEIKFHASNFLQAVILKS